MEPNNIQAYQCNICKKLFLPPKTICSTCKNTETTKISLSGHGKVMTSTVVHIPPNYSRKDPPYTVILVKLDEGIPVMGQLHNSSVESLIGTNVSLKKINEDGIYLFDLA
ncbi:MAG: hypothetical protein CL760_02930 [Chloroflexi bacterium]|nr:hypothetical protein [Chloroflexota bacterium]MQG05025.1 hypothetical protein [SAR202 cluster bacterium]|tara:strand:- start:2850 stop:3179 length:330 start_codon:yes stop_codon:yes gene_type:complete